MCGKPHRKATRCSYSKYSSILQVLGVNTCNDNEDIHPPAFCNSCYLTAKRSGTRRVVEWQLHNEAYCHICDDMSKGGRPKKSSSGGHPSHLKTHIQSVACSIPPFSLTQVVDNTYIESITCRLCKCAINDPVEVLPCKSLICCSCVIAHLEKGKDAFTCPGCGESHECTSSSFSRVSPMEEKMIKNMMIKCNKCKHVTTLSQSQASCDRHKIDVCSLNLKDIACRPLESQPTTIEKEVATSVVTRLMYQSKDTIVKLPTRGTVS